MVAVERRPPGPHLREPFYVAYCPVCSTQHIVAAGWASGSLATIPPHMEGPW